VAHVEWVDGEAFVFDIGRVGIDLSLEAFLGRDNCVLLDWFKTQAPRATTTTTTTAPPPTTTGTTTTVPPPTTTTTTTTTVVPNPGNTKNCSDFSTYTEAKAWFDTYFPHYGDVAGLDGDSDGEPCESLPGGPAPTTTTTTTTSTTTSTTTVAPPPVVVTISGFAYSGPTEMSAGQTIRFTNLDVAAHTASATGNVFDTGTIASGQSVELVIDQPGTYTYFCRFHNGMTGTITVTS